MLDTAVELIKVLFANPVTGPLIVGSIRGVTGYLQAKYKEHTGKAFSKAEFGATLVKYGVAVNAVSAVLPPEYASVSSGLVLLADIVQSWARKLRKK